MKYFIECKSDDSSKDLKKEITSRFNALGYICDKEKPDIVVSVGGDGTFLRCVQDYLYVNPLFITINKGNLGYLCQFKVEEVDDIINSLQNNSHNIKEISLLEASIGQNTIYALNEIRVATSNGSSVKLDVYINDTYLETIKADGVCVSTSIGSSGVARSMGGSLVDNEIEMLEFIEMNPIINSVYNSVQSPFVLNSDKTIKINNLSQKACVVYYDCKSERIYDYQGDIIFKLSNRKIRVMYNINENYIIKTREAMISK